MKGSGVEVARKEEQKVALAVVTWSRGQPRSFLRQLMMQALQFF